MKLRKELIERGYLKQTTCDSIFDKLERGCITFYVGFDCTAQSLHVGHLLPLMLARVLQRYGNRPVLLLGGATSGIGDPTGKTESRKFLSDQEIEQNKLGIRESIEKFIDLNSALIVDNSDWISGVSCLQFLREFARQFSVNQMLSMDFVETRIAQNKHLSLMEFNYVVLQSLDFFHLNQAFNCTLQIGGSDQWGNIVSGIELIRKLKGEKVFGITLPLLETSSGKKMGKSESGAVWLNQSLLSPYQYFQYWRNVDDADVLRLAWSYCDWSSAEMKEFEELARGDVNLAKRNLAFRLTTLCHGLESARTSDEGAKLAFADISSDEGLTYIPKYYLQSPELQVSLISVLCSSGLAESNSQAKKLIIGGGVKLNGSKIDDVLRSIGIADLNQNGFAKISAGKKRHALICLAKD